LGQKYFRSGKEPLFWILFSADMCYNTCKRRYKTMTSTPLPHDHGQPPEPTLAAMPDTENFQTIAELLKQLGDSSRIRIFWLLCHCEECVINLSAMMKMSSPAISHHLKQLKSSGLIVSRRSGKEVYYRAADTQQAQLLHRMIETLLQINCPDPTIGR
jgi:transcriptional regulator, arsR family